MQTQEIIKGRQLCETPDEDIKEYKVDGNMVIAVFYNAKQAAAYIKKFSAFAYTPNWYDQIGFANFNVNFNEIIAYSTYHPASSMIKMFENGLKNL